MEEKVLTRRTALKIMGSAALATMMATTGASALTSCIEGRKKRVVLYFTGTGNCLYVARQLAGKEGEILSIPQLMRKKQFEIEADEIGLVYPIYGHMPPYMVREFIKKAQLKAEYKFAVLTYGMRKCNAVEIWDGISRKAGNVFDYIGTIIMVDNWLPNFDMNEQMKIDKHIPENLAKITSDLSNRRRWHEPVTQEEREQHEGFMSLSGLDPEVGFLMKADRSFRVTDDCIRCGICTYVCPRGNYQLTGQGVKMQGDCEFCFACIQNCPQRAIQFKKNEDGTWPDGSEKNPNARYRNENVSLMELKLANNQKV
ncbi:EFR1 family ferrodoxin [Segatella copri]|uniref:EFR1 family ferrodoxin n=1 Tax=Segatella copri TaxID=165179 RepID=UPI003B585D96